MAAAKCVEPSTSSQNSFDMENLVLNYKMLKPLDDALRCRICDDYYNNCMMTKCNHNYCSVCIRRYMTYKSQCPTCFQDASEPELQNNRLIDEIIRLYKKFREFNDEEASYLPPTPKTPACSFYAKDVSDSQSTSSMLSQSSSSDIPVTPRVKIEIPDDKGSTSRHVQVYIKKEPGVDEVTCPVCYNSVLNDTINTHLDSCLKLQFDEPDRRKMLPKLVYHLLTDKEIKKRLKEHGLPVTGDRQALIRRHKSFITLYNANCDDLNPKPVSELVKEIEIQELEERLNSLPKEIQLNKKSDLSFIEHQHQSYIKKHQSQFNALINDVHQRQIAQIHIKREKEDPVIECNAQIHIKKEQEDPVIESNAHVHIKKEKEDPVIESNENTVITLSEYVFNSHDRDKSIKIEEPSISGIGNSKDIDLIDPSSLDDFDIKKTPVNPHHKRKKASLSHQNQASPKKK